MNTNNKKRVKTYIRYTSLIALLINPVQSMAELDINKIKAFFDAGNSVAVYELTVGEASHYEGDPVFDYYYGISAIDTGRASEGVFALERVLLAQPDNHAARLELARGYYILEEYSRSRQEFETVLGAEPPKDVRDRIYAFLDAIRLEEGRYNTTQTIYVDVGYGADSNANSGPNVDTLTVGDFLFFFGEDQQEQDDTFAEYAANYRLNTPITPGTSYFFSLNGSGRSYSDLSEFDTITYTFDTGFQFLHAQDSYTVDILAQQFNLDGEEYRKMFGLNTNWRRHLSQQTTLQTYLQFAQQEFSGQEFRDVDTTTLGAGLSRRINILFSPVLFSNLYIAQDEAKLAVAKATAERDYYGLRIGTAFSISGNKSIQLAFDYQSSEYGAVDIILNTLREETLINAALDFTWLLNRNWSLFARASAIQNESNDATKEYDRTQYSLNLRYEIK